MQFEKILMDMYIWEKRLVRCDKDEEKVTKRHGTSKQKQKADSCGMVHEKRERRGWREKKQSRKINQGVWIQTIRTTTSLHEPQVRPMHHSLWEWWHCAIDTKKWAIVINDKEKTDHSSHRIRPLHLLKAVEECFLWRFVSRLLHGYSFIGMNPSELFSPWLHCHWSSSANMHRN